MKHLPIVVVESRCEMNHVSGLTFMCDTFIGTVYGKGRKQDKKWNVIIFRETVAYATTFGVSFVEYAQSFINSHKHAGEKKRETFAGIFDAGGLNVNLNKLYWPKNLQLIFISSHPNKEGAIFGTKNECG